MAKDAIMIDKIKKCAKICESQGNSSLPDSPNDLVVQWIELLPSKQVI